MKLLNFQNKNIKNPKAQTKFQNLAQKFSNRAINELNRFACQQQSFSLFEFDRSFPEKSNIKQFIY